MEPRIGTDLGTKGLFAAWNLNCHVTFSFFHSVE